MKARARMSMTLAVALAGAAMLLAAAAAMAADGAGAAMTAKSEVLKTLRKGHPRLFLAPEVEKRIRDGIASNPDMKRVYEKTVARADRLLREPPVVHKLIGPRLLSVSREALRRISTLALVYRLSGDEKYAARAWKELETISGFRDWNPAHFLDTAEMSAAAGIGFDWLYDYLSPEQRATIVRGLVTNGLEPGLRCYRGEAKYGWWTKSRHNWNQVCNGGLAQGALAVADEVPDVAAEIVAGGLATVPPAMANFGIDGGWDEGPGYWGYTMMYTSRYLDALKSALGTMHGIEKTPGLADAGMFRIYSTGPTGRYFNFADAGESVGSSDAMFWLARTFDRPVYAWHERQRMDDDPFNLIWYVAEGKDPAASGLPAGKQFRGVDVVYLRSAWNDPKALWVGFKGGDNGANHSNLDLGTFVLDAGGVRWVVELGKDDYNLPGYFGGQRWTYYRLRTEGQNTLVINGENQATRAKAPIVAFEAADGGGSATADLSAGYPMCRSVRRTVTMSDGRSVRIEDEVEAAAEPVEVVWAVHTEAEVALDGPRATLRQDGRTMAARIVEPEGAVFETLSATPPKPQAQNEGITKLAVRLGGVSKARLVVEFAPAGE